MARLHVRQRGRGWVYVIERGKYPAGHAKEGKRWQEWSRQFPSAEEAELAGARRLLELGHLTSDPSQITVAEWMREWLDVWRSQVAASTMDTYANTVERHIIPNLGSLTLAEISPRHIQRWQNNLLKTLAPGTVIECRRVLRTGLGYAVSMEILSRQPVSGVRAPAAPSRAKRVWSAEQVRMVLDGIEDAQISAALRLLATTGMRVGDLLALRWEDIDLNAGVLTIARHARRSKERGLEFVEGRKSGAGRRIELDSTTVSIMRAWSVEQKKIRLRSPMWRDEGLVMTVRFHTNGVMGGALSTATIRLWVEQAAKRAGVPVLSPHGLRHTWATIALTNGVPLTVVSERLGHASPRITLQTYAHLLPSADRLAASLMDQLYGDTDERDASRNG